MFYLQFMVDFPHGLPGDPAVSPVEKASKRGVVCAVTPFQPTVGSFAKDQIQKHETVNMSCAQVHHFIQQIGMSSTGSYFFSPSYRLSQC